MIPQVFRGYLATLADQSELIELVQPQATLGTGDKAIECLCFQLGVQQILHGHELRRSGGSA
jgi:hypothetical protein